MSLYRMEGNQAIELMKETEDGKDDRPYHTLGVETFDTEGEKNLSGTLIYDSRKVEMELELHRNQLQSDPKAARLRMTLSRYDGEGEHEILKESGWGAAGKDRATCD